MCTVSVLYQWLLCSTYTAEKAKNCCCEGQIFALSLSPFSSPNIKSFVLRAIRRPYLVRWRRGDTPFVLEIGLWKAADKENAVNYRGDDKVSTKQASSLLQSILMCPLPGTTCLLIEVSFEYGSLASPTALVYVQRSIV